MNIKVSAAFIIATNTFKKYVEFPFMLLYISIVMKATCILTKIVGCSIAQAVNHQLLTTVVQVHSHVRFVVDNAELE
jgi:hypothetical protein